MNPFNGERAIFYHYTNTCTMKKHLKCIMLIDDNQNDNFFHEREIRKSGLENITVVTKHSADDALDYLKLDQDEGLHPDLIFLDINMPGMDGWEFLVEYAQLKKEQQSENLVMMLTTYENLREVDRAKAMYLVTNIITKPLTRTKIMEINNKYFTPFSIKISELNEVLN